MVIDVRGTKMLEEDWKRVRHFSPKERWGNWRKVDRNLVFLIDAFREFVGKPVVLHNAYDTAGHTDGSYHYRGMALDAHVEGMTLMDMFFALTRFDEFNGVGLYPFWTWDGKLCPGFHGDIRPKSERFKPDSRWMCTRGGVYVPLSWENLKEAVS